MCKRISNRLGRDLGLTGAHADVPAFQIVNDAHDRFFSLTSRMIGKEYDPDAEKIKNHELWSFVTRQRTAVAERIGELGGDAFRASNLITKIADIERQLDLIDQDVSIGL